MSMERGAALAAGKKVTPPGVSVPEGKSLTKQVFAEECDINQIIARAEASGAVGHLNGGVPVYADVSEIPDYRSSLDIVRQSEEMFMELPASVRRRFDNDPAQLMDFVMDEKNREEAQSMGLLKPPAKPAEFPVEKPPLAAGGEPPK